MEVKQYYRKVREIRDSFTEIFPLIVSLETPDGGKAGLVSEVSREIAAKMIVEGRAKLASDKEKAAYKEQQVAAKKAAEKAALAKRIQVAIIADPESETSFQSRKGPDSTGGGK